MTLPGAADRVDEFLAEMFKEDSSLTDELKRLTIRCEALYYDPSLSQDLGSGRVLPGLQRLDDRRLRRILRAILDHLSVLPKPEGFVVNSLAALLVAVQLRGAKLSEDVRLDPQLAGGIEALLQTSEPDLSTSGFRMISKLLRRRLREALQAV